MMGRMTAIDFYFDPSCPWAYVTSVWARDVAELRGMQIRWRAFSLRFKNAPPEGAPATPSMGNRCLRVTVAAREQYDDEAVGRLYSEMGQRRHSPDKLDIGSEEQLRSVLEACGLDPALAIAADDEEQWDPVIRAEMAVAIEKAGNDVGVPIIVLDGGEGPGWFGPVISRAPRGDDALALWDAFETMARLPGFYEMKRARSERPQVGP